MKNCWLSKILTLVFVPLASFGQNFSWGLSTDFLLAAPEYLQDYTMVQDNRLENYYETYFENGISQSADEYKYVLRYAKAKEYGASLNFAYNFGKKKHKKLKPFKVEAGISYFKANIYMEEANVIVQKSGNWALSYDDDPNLYISQELESFQPSIKFHYSIIRQDYFYTTINFGAAKRFLLDQNAARGSDIGQYPFTYDIYTSLPWMFTLGISPGYIFKKHREERTINLYMPISFSIYTAGNQNELYWNNTLIGIEQYSENFIVREERSVGYRFSIGIGVEFGKTK